MWSRLASNASRSISSAGVSTSSSRMPGRAGGGCNMGLPFPCATRAARCDPGAGGSVAARRRDDNPHEAIVAAFIRGKPPHHVGGSVQHHAGRGAGWIALQRGPASASQRDATPAGEGGGGGCADAVMECRPARRATAGSSRLPYRNRRTGLPPGWPAPKRAGPFDNLRPATVQVDQCIANLLTDGLWQVSQDFVSRLRKIGKPGRN